MRAGLRIGILATAAITAAVAVPVTLTLPPRARELPGALPPNHIPGAYHIHSTRSDGTGAPDAIARAASRAGVRFVILTDHGDGTRRPDPPAYVDDVLVIDAVEINTRDGHLVALGLDAASPYPLAGRAADVIADIHRLGGTAVIAHPDSPRSELAWRGGLGQADGIEWINVDSEWRDERALTLLARSAHAIARGPEAIASLFARPAQSLQRWDNQARTRPVFGLAALDAHASIGWREQEEPRRSVAIAQPGYEVMFRTLAQVVVLDGPLSGDAAADAPRVLDALVAGRSYSVVRAFAWPALLELTATSAGQTLAMGDRVSDPAGPVTIAVRTPTAPGARIDLLHDGATIEAGQGSLTRSVSEAGVYRVEVRQPDRAVPWIVANPIVLGGGPAVAGEGRGGRGRGNLEPPGIVEARPIPATPDGWTIEHEASSTGTVADDDGRLRFDYALGAGTARGQYAALVHTDPGVDGVQTISFMASATAPMRISVQVRLPAGRGRVGQRWRTSIYIDEIPRPVTLRLQDFEPADRPTARQPLVTPIESLLFVVDTVNTAPGATGTVWLSNVALGVNRMQ